MGATNKIRREKDTIGAGKRRGKERVFIILTLSFEFRASKFVRPPWIWSAMETGLRIWAVAFINSPADGPASVSHYFKTKHIALVDDEGLPLQEVHFRGYSKEQHSLFLTVTLVRYLFHHTLLIYMQVSEYMFSVPMYLCLCRFCRV